VTITEFMEARIAEDEAMARAAIRHGDGAWRAGDEPDPEGDVYDERAIYGDDLHIYDEGGHDENHAAHIARHDPARVLAECKAKRAVLAEIKRYRWDEDPPPIITRALAAVHADHPDYRQEWAL
jgi:hypothetical protein